MNKVLNLKFYSDPGHGWLAIKRNLLVKEGLLNHISPYSYQRGATVYLEEDRDASIVVNALQGRGYTVWNVPKHTDKTSPIRSYESFRL